jgi:hypothetical protein
MTYQSHWNLNYDTSFNERTRACLTDQGLVFISAADPAYVALAHAVLRADILVTSAFISVIAGSPGLAEAADPDGDGTVDDALVTDEMLLATVQAQWPTVAALFFDAEGQPIGETTNE